MSTVTIFSATHKKCTMIENSVYTPIHVGAKNSSVDLGILRDDSGDNISSKNYTLCEMTAAYWAWKNCQSDYVGLCHYRRLFAPKYSYLKYFKELAKYTIERTIGLLIRPGSFYFYQKSLEAETESDFKKYADDFANYIQELSDKNAFDIMVASPWKYTNIKIEWLFRGVGTQNMDRFMSCVKDVSPKLYPILVTSLSKRYLYPANMVVMRKDLYNNYCRIMFDILGKMETDMVKDGYCTEFYKEKCTWRLLGYFAELITNAYVQMQIKDGYRISTAYTLTPGKLF